MGQLLRNYDEDFNDADTSDWSPLSLFLSRSRPSLFRSLCSSIFLPQARAISLCMCAFYVCFVCPGCLAHAYVCMCMCVGVCTYFNTYVDTCMQLRSYTRLPSSLPCTRRLEVGDVITEIEGEPVVHKSCEDVVRLLTGKEHSQVKLCCLRLQVS